MRLLRRGLTPASSLMRLSFEVSARDVADLNLKRTEVRAAVSGEGVNIDRRGADLRKIVLL